VGWRSAEDSEAQRGRGTEAGTCARPWWTPQARCTRQTARAERPGGRTLCAWCGSDGPRCARRAELHRQTARAKQPLERARSASCGGRGLCRGERGRFDAADQNSDTGAPAKREHKRRLQERGEPHALGVECDASAASTMMGEVGEAEVDSLRRGRAKVGACGMPARRTLCRCARGARCPRSTHASPRVRVRLQEVTVPSSRMATPVLVWVGKSVLAVSSCARAPLHLQLTGAGAGGARGRGCAMARAMALRGRESRTR
jgi:hypothetical protein